MNAVVADARRAYESLGMDALPDRLRRNNLDYYYLSVWPGLADLSPAASIDLPPYPASLTSAYFHLPFCSGLCSFCSYYVVVPHDGDRSAIESYVETLLHHVELVGERTELDLGYLYFGGGTPSLLLPEQLDRLLDGLRRNGCIAENPMGTIESHPELFADRGRAAETLAVLGDYGIKRISLGVQFDDTELLANTNRRHGRDLYTDAMEQLRAADFMTNLDAMYGCPGQSVESWVATLERVVALAPDSISAYCTFIDPGTKMWNDVRSGAIETLPHDDIQTQHIATQLVLEAAGFGELPNDFYTPQSPQSGTFAQSDLPSDGNMVAFGAGAYGFHAGTQLFNEFSIQRYGALIRDRQLPIWRAKTLDDGELLVRDIIFSLKNSPELRQALFRDRYGVAPTDAFPQVFEQIEDLDLGAVEDDIFTLSPKGRLVVEELCCLFTGPSRPTTEEQSPGEQALIRKHHFAPTYADHPT